MVIFTALPAGTSSDEGRILVDESDYRGVENEQLPFEIKDTVRIRADEKFSKFYEFLDELGEGKFGKVYRCRERKTGLELAAKRIKIKRDADREKVEREVAIMTKLRHPRIAQIYDAFATPDNDIVLVMEIVNGGELFDRVVDENYILTELAVVMIVCQLCEAISYIHSQNIVHLDIKPENIMCVSQTGNRIKLIDFGLAQFYDGSSNLLFMAGTPEFVAPEVIKFEPIDFHTDMWSIGVITYILLSGISPFLGETLGDTYVAVEKGEWEFDDEAFEFISEAAKDFISKLLIMDQKQRMLPEDCLNHPWVVGSRAKAENDSILNQPNTGTPISKEGLKSYLKNKRFRKATWALVFLIRFKRQTLMNFGRQKVAAPIAEVSDALISVETTTESFAEAGASVVATVELASNEEKKQKVYTDIPVVVEEVPDTAKAEPATAAKHPEEKKLSSEIPKKKPKPSTSDEGRTKKKAKKHKEKSSEKSDEISCKPKKVSKHPKSVNDGSEGQRKKLAGTVPESLEISNTEKTMPVKCEVYITLETKQPAVSFAEFTRPLHVVESTQLCSPLSKVTRINKDHGEMAKPRTGNASPSINRATQEVTRRSNSINKLSEINKKGSSVAAILSMFNEKAEQEKKRFERRPSRPVRTFRDVEKSSSRKTSLTLNNESDANCLKLYRAPEEEKERVKNLIELHRRGSADRRQVGTQEIVAVKQEEGMKSTSRRKIKAAEHDKVATEGKSSTRTKMKVKPAPDNTETKELSESKVVIPGLSLSERSTGKNSGPVTALRENDDTMVIKSKRSMQYKAKTLPKQQLLKNAIKVESQLGILREPEQSVTAENGAQMNAAEGDRSQIRNLRNRNGYEEIREVNDVLSDRKGDAAIKNVGENVEDKKCRKIDKSGKSSFLNISNLKSDQMQQSVDQKQQSGSSNETINIETVDDKIASSSKRSQIHSEKKQLEKKEISKSMGDQNVRIRGKKIKADNGSGDYNVTNTAENLILSEAPEKLVKLSNDAEEKLKERAKRVNESMALIELAMQPDSTDFRKKVKQMESVDANKNKVQKSASTSRSLSVRLSKTAKYMEGDRTSEISQDMPPKRPPKAPGTSMLKKVISGIRVKKLRDREESDGKASSASKNMGNAVIATSNKLSYSVDGTSRIIQNTVTDVQDSVSDPSSSGAPLHDQNKRKLIPKSSSPLMKMRSEINLVERTKKALSSPSETVQLHGEAATDEASVSNRNCEARRSITVVTLNNEENYSFDSLKLQLEARVNKEKEEQITWQPRRDLEISPFQTGNAKKALNIWKTMEQKSISRT